MEQYCSLTIEAWLKLNVDFDKRYLELRTARIFSFNLVFVVLNFRDYMESEYPSIVFLSI